jgi:hypothetical protein
MTFAETDHPRESDGKFAEKTGAAPEVELDGFLLSPEAEPVDFPNGQHVLYKRWDGDAPARILHGDPYEDTGNRVYTLIMDDGNTWSGVYAEELRVDPSVDSTDSIARSASFDAGYKLVREMTDGRVSRSERMHLVDIEAGINEAMNEEWRNQALRGFARLGEETEGTEDKHLRDIIDEAVDDAHASLKRRGFLEGEERELAVTRQTALALFYRNRIDDSSDDWTQDHYDHVTRAWREAVGPIHPDDEARPASWDATQHTAMSPARKYEDYSDKELREQRDRAWSEYRADGEPGARRAAQVLDAAAEHRGLQ